MGSVAVWTTDSKCWPKYYAIGPIDPGCLKPNIVYDKKLKENSRQERKKVEPTLTIHNGMAKKRS